MRNCAQITSEARMDNATPSPRNFRFWLKGLLRNVYQHELSLYAGALTYLSLFALVPLLSVIYSVMASLPMSAALADTAQQALLQHLLPNSSEAVQAQLQEFAQQAQQLTLLGIAGLLLTGFFLIREIEAAFDHIWHIPHKRRTWVSLLIYWCLISLGPILIAIGIGITTWAMSLRWLAEGTLHDWLSWPQLKLTPWLLSFLAFALVYKLMPSGRVCWRDCLTGAATAATLFELAKWGFGWITAKTSYGFVYGTFAAVPLFLLWIHTSWMILLLGAEIVAQSDSLKSTS